MADCRIEPLSETHDRVGFRCGVEALDRYLHQQARQDLRRHLAAVFVLCAADSVEVLGYYTLSTTAIEAADLPPEITRRLPRYPHFPAALLGRLAVDQGVRGQGLGERLLVDALGRTMRRELASMAVVVDAIDEVAARFYMRYGFQRFAGRPSRSSCRRRSSRVILSANHSTWRSLLHWAGKL
jgi:ribosomal protein S18 acetylase RimI-like enzyme